MVRVFLIADVRLHREGLAEFLQREESIILVGSDRTPDDALAVIVETSPEVVLLEMEPPEGLTAVKRLLVAAPGVKVVALSIVEAEVDVISWAEAGISGYVARDGSLTDLVSTIECVAKGEMRCSPRIAATLLRRVGALALGQTMVRPTDATSDLTLREHEIARLIIQGLSNKEISARLCIALPTVKNHVHSILEKTKVRRRADVVYRLGTHSCVSPGARL